jgi:hypothetical protein
MKDRLTKYVLSSKMQSGRHNSVDKDNKEEQEEEKRECAGG